MYHEHMTNATPHQNSYRVEVDGTESPRFSEEEAWIRFFSECTQDKLRTVKIVMDGKTLALRRGIDFVRFHRK